MKKKYRTGYTTGVFDMFHIGHLNIIKNAKERCDFLIVGVSTDELVEEYKHRKPVIPFEQRIEIVRSISYVDQAVAQTSMDKRAAWEALHFDVVFHGDDWKNTSLYKRETERLKEVGVEMVFFQYTQGISSTGLVSKIKEN